MHFKARHHDKNTISTYTIQEKYIFTIRHCVHMVRRSLLNTGALWQNPWDKKQTRERGYNRLGLDSDVKTFNGNDRVLASNLPPFGRLPLLAVSHNLQVEMFRCYRHRFEREKDCVTRPMIQIVAQIQDTPFA